MPSLTEPRDAAVRLDITRTIAATRLAPTASETAASLAFAELGLSGPFWRLRA